MFATVHAAGSSLLGLFTSCTTFDSTSLKPNLAPSVTRHKAFFRFCGHPSSRMNRGCDKSEAKWEVRFALLYVAASALSAVAPATCYVVPGGLGWVHFSICEREREMRDEIREIRASARARDLKLICESRASGSA
eukprot:scaffold28598_cov126-Isochrysis_galbana.AAC.1